MKKTLLLTALLCILALIRVSAAGINKTEDGRMQTEYLKIGFIITLDNDSRIEQQSPGVLSFPAEMPLSTKEGMRRFGKFKLNDSFTFDLTETSKWISPEEVHLHYMLEAPEIAPTKRFGVGTWMSLDLYRKHPILVDGVAHPFAGKMKEKWIKGKKFEFPLDSGVTELYFPRGAEILIKPFGKNVLCQIIFTFGKQKKAQVQYTQRYTPYQTAPVDLRKITNMGFADPVAEDGQGGWTDQGSENDLSMLKPGLQQLSGIKFDIIDPARNNGKSCLAMRGKARPSFCASAKVPVPKCIGNTLFLLNAIAWPPPNNMNVGKVTITYENGKQQEYILKSGVDTANFWAPKKLKNAESVWKGRNKLAEVGLYATRIQLEYQPVISVEFTSMDQVWMIVAASIGTWVPPVESTKVVIKEGKDWAPLPYSTEVEKNSIIDFSHLLDAPAGKYGFVTVKNGHFEFANRPGVPVRFWGCNICSLAHYDTFETTVKLMDHISQCGYNVIRLHHFDHGLVDRKGLSQDEINPKRLDHLDIVFSEAKKRGIYVTLDLYTLRKWAKIPKYGQLKDTQYKVLCYFDPDVRQDLIRFAKGLLEHKNPYTGLRWADDPALIFINLVNEGTFPMLLPKADAIGKAAIDKAFGVYLRANKLEDTQENRARHYNDFLIWTGKNFYNHLKNELRSIGVKVPLCDQNYETPMGGTRHLYDYVDAHFYWAHPLALNKSSEELPNYISSLSAISAYAGGIRYTFNAPIYGKPMVSSEWNHCHPNPYIFEGPLLVGAYASLQDYDGLMQFYYAGQTDEEKNQRLAPFLIGTNPLMRLAARCGALLYLRRDVTPAPLSVLMTEKAASQIGSRLPLITQVRQYAANAPKHLPLIAALGETQLPDSRTVIRRGKDNVFYADLQKAGIIPKNETGNEKKPITSVTGEIMIDPDKNLFQVTTANSEGMVVMPNLSMRGEFMSVKNGQAPAAFFVASMDGRPLKKSSKLILMHLTDVKCDGNTFSDKDMTIQENAGDPKKFLLRRNRAVAELNISRPCRIFACDYTGKRLFEVPTKKMDGKLQIELNNNLNNQCVMLYELAF